MTSQPSRFLCPLNVLTLALLLSAAVNAVPVLSQTPTPAATENDRSQLQQSEKAKGNDQLRELNASQQPIVVQLLPASVNDEERRERAQDREVNASNQFWLVASTVVIALFTAVLALVTGMLWGVTRSAAARQSKDTQHALNVARKSAEAATKSAEAAVRSTEPFLVPKVIEVKLNPRAEAIDDQSSYLPTITIGFQNIGRSPAMLRRIGIVLTMTEEDVLDLVPPALESITSVESIDNIASDGIGGVRSWKYSRRITSAEARKLESDTNGEFSRWYVVGYVIFEDVFGTRHTKRFCMKVRQNGFVALRKHGPYNQILREPASESAPGGTESEDA